MRRKAFVVLVVLVTLVGLGASAPQNVTAQADNALVIYSGRSESLVGALIEQFKAATGIDVKVRFASTPELAATLLEEGPNTPADLFYAQDPGGLGAVQSMLGMISQSALDRVSPQFRASTSRWVGISGRARTLVYNTSVLSEADLPDDLFGLSDPRWKGRIGWAPSNASFQTMVTAMRKLWGETKTKTWLEGVQANDPKVYPKNAPQVAAVAAGEIDIGLVNHYYLFRFLATEGESFPVRNYHPRGGGPGALVMVSGVGILNNTPHRAAAEKFVDFMLSTVAQQYFASVTFEYPVVEGVRTDRLLLPLADINAPRIDLADLADLAGTQTLLQAAGVLP